MAVNEDFQGRTYDPTPPFSVGREHIRDFAAAVGASDPIHHDVEAAHAAGYADLVAPPTFAVIPGQRTDGQFGLISMCCGGALATGTIIERL